MVLSGWVLETSCAFRNFRRWKPTQVHRTLDFAQALFHGKQNSLPQFPDVSLQEALGTAGTERVVEFLPFEILGGGSPLEATGQWA